MGQVSAAKDKLIASAIKLMYARSYADVGVQELCDQAGVKKGSFYHFFPSKRDLTLAALDRQAEVSRQFLTEPAFANRSSPVKRLERWFEMMYEQTCGMKDRTGHVCGCPMGNLAMEMSTQDEVIRSKVDRMFRAMAEPFETVLREAVLVGEIPKQDVKATAQALVAYAEGILMLAKARNDPKVIRNLAKGFVRNLIGGDSPGVRKSGSARQAV